MSVQPHALRPLSTAFINLDKDADISIPPSLLQKQSKSAQYHSRHQHEQIDMSCKHLDEKSSKIIATHEKHQQMIIDKVRQPLAKEHYNSAQAPYDIHDKDKAHDNVPKNPSEVDKGFPVKSGLHKRAYSLNSIKNGKATTDLLHLDVADVLPLVPTPPPSYPQKNNTERRPSRRLVAPLDWSTLPPVSSSPTNPDRNQQMPEQDIMLKQTELQDKYLQRKHTERIPSDEKKETWQREGMEYEKKKEMWEERKREDREWLQRERMKEVHIRRERRRKLIEEELLKQRREWQQEEKILQEILKEEELLKRRLERLYEERMLRERLITEALLKEEELLMEKKEWLKEDDLLKKRFIEEELLRVRRHTMKGRGDMEMQNERMNDIEEQDISWLQEHNRKALMDRAKFKETDGELERDWKTGQKQEQGSYTHREKHEDEINLSSSQSLLESLAESTPRYYQTEAEPDEMPQGEGQLVPCNLCSRRFAVERLEKHHAICEKLQNSKRKVFNSFKHRAKGTDLEEFMKTNIRSKTPEAKTNNRQKHENFIRNLRHTRGPNENGSQALVTENPDYVTCPHCKRRFAPGPAERHIPKCLNIKSRPPPPPPKRS